ncbi:unnamed protein product [Bursaphelenchus xylophilus]|uniref:(pine wood nematode) hypothetical protein n=1 Tax=Bursaphelenchus xylophilus TaxID=6326 RepID=A0A1I7S8R4_BURXY|nr:unnamed protein product [Bursaphelenchus xylophilus]CAG9089264.1 unnamed protein product [Bursaphelenchus xylophilus]
MSILGVLANLLLFLLVRNHTPNVMKSYRKVLYASCFLDGFTALVHILFNGELSSQDGIHVIRFIGPIPQLIDQLGWLPDGDLAYLLIPGFFFQLSVICYCFVPYTYRYLHVVRNSTLRNFEFFLLVLVYLTPALIISISIPLLSVHAYDQLNDYVGKDTSPCSRRVPIFDIRIVTLKPPLHSVAQACSSSILLTLVFPPFLLYFIVRIYMKLNGELQTTAGVATRMQRQITMALTAQSIIPLLLVSLPFFSSIASFWYSNDTYNPGATSTIAFSFFLIPLINPLATIWLFKSYRFAFGEILMPFSVVADLRNESRFDNLAQI